MGKSFGSKVASAALNSMSTLPLSFFYCTFTRATIDPSFNDVPTDVGVSMPSWDSRITNVGKSSGLVCRVLLMVYPPGMLYLETILVWRAAAVPLKNFVQTCLYPSSF